MKLIHIIVTCAVLASGSVAYFGLKKNKEWLFIPGVMSAVILMMLLKAISDH